MRPWAHGVPRCAWNQPTCRWCWPPVPCSPEPSWQDGQQHARGEPGARHAGDASQGVPGCWIPAVPRSSRLRSRRSETTSGRACRSCSRVPGPGHPDARPPSAESEPDGSCTGPTSCSSTAPRRRRPASPCSWRRSPSAATGPSPSKSPAPPRPPTAPVVDGPGGPEPARGRAGGASPRAQRLRRRPGLRRRPHRCRGGELTGYAEPFPNTSSARILFVASSAATL
jgi:hypothetical protein